MDTLIAFLKGLVILIAMLLLFYPILPWRAKRKRFSTVAALRYKEPYVRFNGFFIILVILEIILFVLLFRLLEDIGTAISNIPFISEIMAAAKNITSDSFNYQAFVIIVFIANVIVIYLYVILKSILKKFLDGFTLSDEEKQERKKHKKKKNKDKYRNKKAKKNKKDKKKGKGGNQNQENEESIDEDDEDDYIEQAEMLMPEDPDKDEKNASSAENVPVLERIRKKKSENKTTEKDGEKDNKNGNKIYGLLADLAFESPDYIYVKPWVRRIVSIVQVFVYLLEALYFILFALMFVMVMFPSNGLSAFMTNVIKIKDWYLYPFLSMILLQEICYTFKTGLKETEERKSDKKLTEEEKKEEDKIAIRALSSELKRYFDDDHKLRFYPGVEVKDGKFEYQFTNKLYKGALEYIRERLGSKTGNRNQSYLEFADAMFNDEHVYFCASFYSEIGEYIITYTYIRLLAGSRMIFIVKDPAKRDAVRRYILNRLIEMTGSGKDVTWRVYTSEERLDQADVLVASPDDFRDDNIVENCPDFFEEVCNAVFIDSDKVVSLESYLCPVMALRLLNATSNRIRFVFLSQDLIRGFAASSLPKLFCLEKVLSFSSANDNERVEYTLWNKESIKNRIYYKSGQKLMSLEGIIAEKAYKYGIDGIRVVTSSPIDHGEREVLTEHGVEINEFYKDIPNINYMIYSDERCNLAAAIYSCTRFKGKRNSVVQIISKPYLLREYFMSRATKENFIKRSSFIQPRITEHAEKERLSLLKVFCRASTVDGMSTSDFTSEMKNVISLSRVRGDVPLCSFCSQSKFDDLDRVPLKDYAAYLIAALCDTPSTELQDSLGNKAKDYYLVVDHVKHGLYSLTKEKFISFRKVKEVLDRVFACDERVVLRLNDATVGYLDTFPTRVPLEYMVGQSIVYNNVEYEIEQISADCKIIFLRRENVTFKNCLDTIFLRRYKIGETTKIGQDGVLFNSESKLKEIRVSYQKASIIGETYGFYNLMSNNQSLNFVRGVEGNPHLERDAVERNMRNLEDGRLLRVTLTTDMDCTDGMRLLCSAVFNEFIKTIFPKAYRCVAICPILLDPLKFNEENEAVSMIEKIESLYPYILNAEERNMETDAKRMQFLIINDCKEDIGVFDWFYDKLASNLQELIINTYSYMFWLKSRPDLDHYIYFGMDKLPECFDLEGCCNLFSAYNIIISDSGEKNYETAAEYEDEEQRRCSFCHKLMESGRYMYFDQEKTLFLCADCMDLVLEDSRLDEIYTEVKKYLEITYPEITFGHVGVRFAPEGESLKYFNEWYFRLDPNKRKITVVFGLPERETKVALLLGIISMWQYDNDLMNQYSNAQLSFEQIKYLMCAGKTETAEWILSSLDPMRRNNYNDIDEKIKENSAEKTAETDNDDVGVDFSEDIAYTSFTFMREIAEELKELEEEVDYEDIEGEEYFNGLYDPNKTPRFWKRYLKNSALDETVESEDDETVAEVETAESEEGETDADLNDDAFDETETTEEDNANDNPDESETED